MPPSGLMAVVFAPPPGLLGTAHEAPSARTALRRASLRISAIVDADFGVIADGVSA